MKDFIVAIAWDDDNYPPGIFRVSAQNFIEAEVKVLTKIYDDHVPADIRETLEQFKEDQECEVQVEELIEVQQL